MPDWTHSIREQFEAAGRIIDQDIVDELSQHADGVYELARAEGRSAEEATQEVKALVAAWCANARSLHRRPRLPGAVEPPSCQETFWLRTVLHDARYGLRLLKRQPGHTAVAMLTTVLGKLVFDITGDAAAHAILARLALNFDLLDLADFEAHRALRLDPRSDLARAVLDKVREETTAGTPETGPD